MLKADFHIHTFYSKCSDMTPRNLVKTALSKGYNVLGVVDHDNIKGGLAAKKIAGRKILVLPGEEIKTNKGEIVVFFSDGKYSKNLEEICERARDMNHFVFAPHPFDYLRKSLKGNVHNIVKDLDAVETFNSRVMIDKFNKKALVFAKKNRIPKIVGSDAHFIEEIGNVSAFLDCNRSRDSVLEALRKGKMEFRGKKCSPYSHFKTTVVLRVKRIL